MEHTSRKRKPKNRKRGRKVRTIQRFRKQPEIYKISLTARTYDTASSAGSPVWNRYGLLEPTGLIPQYMAALYQIYRKARIVNSVISIKLINTGSEPIELVVGTMPFDWVSGSPTIAELVGKVGTKRQVVSIAGGMDRCAITKSVSSKSLLGHEYMLADFDFSYSQAISSTPIDSQEPVWYVACTALNSSTPVSYRIELVVTSDIEFFDLYTA
jgi:hypothetical protein